MILSKGRAEDQVLCALVAVLRRENMFAVLMDTSVLLARAVDGGDVRGGGAVSEEYVALDRAHPSEFDASASTAWCDGRSVRGL